MKYGLRYTFKHPYLFVKYGGAPFIKKIIKEGNDLPAGFVLVEYDMKFAINDDEPLEYDFRSKMIS